MKANNSIYLLYNKLPHHNLFTANYSRSGAVTALRFLDEEVLEGINNVTIILEGWIEESKMKIHPLPPPAGDKRRLTV